MFLKAPTFPVGGQRMVSTAEDFGAFAKFMFTGVAPGGKSAAVRGRR